ncbi:MAG: ABC transporter ATP-binding protein [Anaerostipes sp.]|nr:ABC transporter ATP-binding protein [Anaerostipes sp.]
MISVKDLRKTYLLGEEEVHALDGVSLEVDDKEFVAIIGQSGSGKSTLMNMLGCLDVPDTGDVLIDGENLAGFNENQLSVLRNEKIGFIFQQFNLLAKLDAFENVELPLIYQGIKIEERKKRVEKALCEVGLKERMHHKPNQLSGGQQQRVAIARALIANPTLILADEPTGNLDSKSSKDIMKVLHQVHEQGNTIVLITHDNDVAKEAGRQIRIMDGKIVYDSAKEEFDEINPGN